MKSHKYNGRISLKKQKEKNKKTYKAILSIIFLIFIIGLALFNLVKTDNLISEQENRKLQQKPKFSVANLIKGNFNKEYNSYISDQFPMRDFWIKLKSNIELSIGKNNSNNVFVCKDNYLIEGFKESSLEETNEKVDTINQFVNKNQKLNISFMLVPTATKIWEDKLPKFAPVDDELKYISDFKSKLDSKIKFIDTYDTLNKNKDEDIYYKTDHHWTTKGAYLGYKEMCKTTGITPKEENQFEVEEVTNNFYGSLYSKLGAGIGNPDAINIYFPKEQNDIVVNYCNEQKKVASLYINSSLDEKDKYQVFTGGNHSLINIKSLAGDPKKKLLVIKDSYANSFLPFLTPHYGEIDVVDLRYYIDNLNELIDLDDITDVLFLFNVNTFNEDKSILNLSE